MHRGQAEHVYRRAEVPPVQAEEAALRLGRRCLFLRVVTFSTRGLPGGGHERVLIDAGRLNSSLDALVVVVFSADSEGVLGCSTPVD